MKTCKECKYFNNKEKHKDGFIVGSCDLEPFDVRDIKSTDMAVQCGHDGGISIGENFGCINWEAR